MDWERRLREWATELELAERLDSDRWVTLARAGEISGASRSTLRSWYRAGRVRSRLVDGPHGPQRLLAAADVLARAHDSAHIRRRIGGELAVEARLLALTARVEQQFTALAGQLARLTERQRALEAEVERGRGRRPST